MPRIESAKKAMRVSLKRREQNRETKKNFKSALKKAKESREKQDVSKAVSLLDRAAAKNVIHKNKAARLKSRLSKSVLKEKETIKKPKPRRKKTTKK